jgi:hypothetical protein
MAFIILVSSTPPSTASAAKIPSSPHDPLGLSSDIVRPQLVGSSPAANFA